ncbi:MAG: T9SS type A sorting domain-containing protein [Chitinophagales bacterium]|nr:T9SS type A sorting domain-containing protein [Chitinophagales bacterium]
MQKRIITILAILLFGIQFQSFALTCPTSTPCNVTVTQDLYNNNDVILSWGTVTGAEGYTVYYKKVNEPTPMSFTVGPQTTTVYMPIFLFQPGAAYRFGVSTILKGGGNSSIATIKSDFEPPITPTAVTLIIEFNIGGTPSSPCSRGTIGTYSFANFAAYGGDFSSTSRPPLAPLKGTYSADILNYPVLENYNINLNYLGNTHYLPAVTRSSVLTSFTPSDITPSPCSTTWRTSSCTTTPAVITNNRVNQYLSNYIKQSVCSLGICPNVNYSVNNYYLNSLYTSGITYTGCYRAGDSRYCGSVCASTSLKTDETEQPSSESLPKLVEDQDIIDEFNLLIANSGESFNLYQKEDNVTLALGGNNNDNYSVVVFDQTGRIVEKQDELNSSSHTFNIVNYSKGMYIVSVIQNGNRQTKKFMKY